MTDFVRDLTALDFPKADLNPITVEDPAKHLEAANWNKLCQAVIDVRAWILTGLTPGSYPIATLTVDADGRITGVVGSTATAVLDGISPAPGALIARGAGTWGALANIAIDNGDFTFSDVPAPVAPPASKVKVFGASSGGRMMLGQLGAGGAKFLTQPFLGGEHIAAWITSLNNAITTIGMITPSTAGTVTGGVLAATNSYTASRRLHFASAVGAGSIASIRCATAFLLRQEGFHIVMRFGVSDAGATATGRIFCGIRSLLTAPTDVDPSGQTNLIGIGTDANDTVLQLYAAGAAAQARVSLGANFPSNTTDTDAYELALNATPGGDMTYVVTRVNTGHTASGTLTGVQLPSVTTFLTPHVHRSNGATGIIVGFDVFGLYAGTPL